MQVAKDREAVFEVGLEFKITRTVDVSVFIVVAVLVVASGTDAADRKGTDAIRSADVELLVIRGGTGVAVAPAINRPTRYCLCPRA